MTGYEVLGLGWNGPEADWNGSESGCECPEAGWEGNKAGWNDPETCWDGRATGRRIVRLAVVDL